MADFIDYENLTLEVMSRCLDLSEDACRFARWRETEAWDSFAFVEIIAELEERLGITIDEGSINQVSDYSSLAAIVAEAAAR